MKLSLNTAFFVVMKHQQKRERKKWVGVGEEKNEEKVGNKMSARERFTSIKF